MISRSKWDITIDDEECISENRNSPANNIDKQTILELLDNNSLTSHFQPIFSSKDGTVYGYEALTRIKGDNNRINIVELFKKAILTNTISSLDMKCRENAISLASSLGINHINAYLFINICPEVLMDPAHSFGITDKLAEDFGISKEKIILELSQNMHFDVCYIDIDNFKPYNDHYGFEKGDMAIKTLACIIEESIKQDGFDFSFTGHIGGDDFILITPPQISIPACEKIISSFESTLPVFHEMEDYNRGCYVSKNRKNEKETFNLLSLSVGIVSTEVYKIESFAQLASIATEVKKAAKMKSASTCRSSILRDRRLMG